MPMPLALFAATVLSQALLQHDLSKAAPPSDGQAQQPIVRGKVCSCAESWTHASGYVNSWVETTTEGVVIRVFCAGLTFNPDGSVGAIDYCDHYTVVK